MPDTHYVCSHHYYLAASTYEEGLGEAVYDLGEVGEIRNIQWLKPSKELTSRLRLTVTNFPNEYFAWNRNLTKIERIYTIEVGLDRLVAVSAK